MATHKTGKCPVGKHRVSIFSPWRSAATACLRLSPCPSEQFFPLLSSTGEVCRGGSPPAGAFAFLHSNNKVPRLLALACRVLPCSRAYFRSNWIVSLSVSMGVGDGAAQQRIKESSAAAVALFWSVPLEPRNSPRQFNDYE